ncbi:gliding motility-associated protein GldE [Crocinitomicaceae bacterium CZZ-1]|uniref:Gliding motility-associated protein GldE n=1 Tax=Taishania pollutisoli TaxID=2766479 RepID=A0A8J6P552_9FLAO|nr:gliding motility-associated protein GldE [Taishania pollutisoli]MBC9811929.1 gliding motility-associated protein GldE [Taishania pollutisoli]
MTAPADPSPEPLANTALITFGSDDVLLVVIILLLLAASALFAGAEVAFFSITQSEKEQLKKSEARGAKIAEKLLDKPKDLLATILIGKNFLNVAFVLLSAIELTKLFLLLQMNEVVAQVLNIIIITLFLLFVGESFPKTVAFKNKAAYARFMAYSIYFFQILPPFSWLRIPLAKSSGVLERRAKRKGIKLSPDTLETVLTLSQNASESNGEYTILQGVMKFGNTDVKQIMCPRMDVVGVDEKYSLTEVMKVIVDAGYSRLPVYRESFDDVVGIIFVKDLLPLLTIGDAFDWRTLIREPFFVPENKKIDELLKEFQSKKVHIAVVIDEYGGSSGIVTLEDVLEEIVGDIIDEYDDDEVTYTQLNDVTFLFEGRTPLTDFYRALNIDGTAFEEIKEDAESLGGFIVQTAGRIPKNNEFLTIGNIKLIVELSDKKKIKKVKAVIEN